MPTSRECVCCWEIQSLRCKRRTWRTPVHSKPSWISNSLSWSLCTSGAYYQYCQQYEERPEQGNALKRYTAYRQFVRWCWHFLGKEVRVVIPSCAVVKIRTAFPDENYTGFHQADSDWNGSISSALLHPCLVCGTRCKVEVVPQCTAGCLHRSCGTLLRLKMLYSSDNRHNNKLCWFLSNWHLSLHQCPI